MKNASNDFDEILHSTVLDKRIVLSGTSLEENYYAPFFNSDS